jgi:hypothetical protein
MSVVINGTSGISGVDGSAGTPAVQGTDTNTGILFPATDTVAIATNGSEQMRVDSSGNVGIGTASPASKLHVVGSFRQTGATAPFEWTVNAGANDYLKLNAVGYADNLIVANSAGNVGIGTSSPAAKLDIGSGNLTFSSTGQRITGDMSNATIASRVMFQSSTTNGITSVGVLPNGTATQSQINVANNSDPTNAGIGQLQAFSTDIRITSGVHGSGTNLPMTFYSGGSERMRLDTSGNVGIGTTSPSQKLTVKTTDGGGVAIQNAAGTEWRWAVNADNSFACVSTGVAERMRIDSSGNLLVGTTASTYNYQSKNIVVADASTAGINVTNLSQILALTAGYGAAYVGAKSNHPLVFTTNDIERARFDISGNLGIGTSSPNTRLTVSSSGAEGINISADTSVATQSGRLFFSNGTSGQSYALMNISGSLLFNSGATPASSSGTERMRITSNGGVSFGSSGTAYGSSGQVLVSNGDTTPTWGSAIVSGTAQATTSGTTKDFTSIPSWVKRITVMFNSVSTSGTSNVQIQLGSSTFTTSGYVGAVGNGAGTNTANSSGFQIAASLAASDLIQGAASIVNISGNIWICNGTSANGNAVRLFSGSISLSGVLDRVRITTVNGTDTFDAGSVNILYE